jgi:hypothetical protein
MPIDNRNRPACITRLKWHGSRPPTMCQHKPHSARIYMTRTRTQLTIIVSIIVAVCVVCVHMSKKTAGKRNAPDDAVAPKEKLPKHVGQALLTKSTATKSSLAHALSVLHTNGMLNLQGNHTEREFKDSLTAAGEEEALRTHTPYGHVVKTTTFTTTKTNKKKEVVHGKFKWEYVDPAAYLHLLTLRSIAFASMLKSTVENGMPTIVLYADEVEPGNPLRHGSQRLMQCIYWCMPEWPQHVLQKANAWLVFGVMQTSTANIIDGGMGAVMRFVLNVFFTSLHNFLAGIVVVSGTGAHYVITCTFAGFLGDEKGLKEIFGLKGASGMKPCISCTNAVRLFLETDIAKTLSSKLSLKGIWTPSLSEFVPSTNELFWSMIDKLKEAAAIGKSYLDQTEKKLGVKLNPHGLWFDTKLRAAGVLKPVDNYIRDPMHSLTAGGAANTGTCLLLLTLLHHHVASYDELQAFTELCTFPKAAGKPRPGWFAKDSIDKKEVHIKCFASELLNIMVTLMMFLKTKASDCSGLLEHIRCFVLLYKITFLIQSGPATVMQYVDVLDRLIYQHHVLWVKLYAQHTIKPKWHHTLHLTKDARKVGKMLTCFVTERKHIDTKAAAVWVFSHVEHSVSTAMINRQIHACTQCDHLYMPCTMMNATSTGEYTMSREVASPVGRLHVSDIVFVEGAGAGRLEQFYGRGTEIVAVVSMFTPTGDPCKWLTAVTGVKFIEISKIVSALSYYPESGGVIIIVLPVLLLINRD